MDRPWYYYQGQYYYYPSYNYHQFQPNYATGRDDYYSSPQYYQDPYGYGPQPFAVYVPVYTLQQQPYQQYFPQAPSAFFQQIENSPRVQMQHVSTNEVQNQPNSPRNTDDTPFQLEDMAPPLNADYIWSGIEDSLRDRRRSRSRKLKETIEANVLKRNFIPSALPNGGSSDKDTCVICLSEYANEEEIGTLRCEHEYHFKCITKWLRKKDECPVCRASALKSSNETPE